MPALPGARRLDRLLRIARLRRTYRQIRPNPYAVVAREDLQIHLFGLDDFDPAESYGNAIVAVPDPDGLYEAFAAGLRERYGKLPVAGIPRIGRPKKRYGTVRGFSVIDPGGNWLRISKLGDVEDDPKAPKARNLDQVVEAAARLGDSHDDEPRALKTLISVDRRHRHRVSGRYRRVRGSSPWTQTSEPARSRSTPRYVTSRSVTPRQAPVLLAWIRQSDHGRRLWADTGAELPTSMRSRPRCHRGMRST